MRLTEKTLKSKNVYPGKVCNLFVDEIELPDGKTSFREYIKHSGGAAILLINEGKVLLVKQFRYAYGKEIFEIPAGKLEIGEDPMQAAIRELKEETGYVATKVKKLCTAYPTPGYTNEILHVYFAEEFRKGEQKLDNGEFLNVVYLDINEVLCLIEQGKICDAKTIIAILKYLNSIK
ncbi:MAG: NUDIX hydrolase [Clostridia bacterium]|nr:NUDIX hydrolase [Clostridia bacterium]